MGCLQGLPLAPDDYKLGGHLTTLDAYVLRRKLTDRAEYMPLLSSAKSWRVRLSLIHSVELSGDAPSSLAGPG